MKKVMKKTVVGLIIVFVSVGIASPMIADAGTYDFNQMQYQSPVIYGNNSYSTSTYQPNPQMEELMMHFMMYLNQIGYTLPENSYNPQSNYNPYVYNPYNQNYREDEPDVETDSARDITDDSAELRGEVDMNDYEDGTVFFVYGEDEDEIDDVHKDFDSYSDVDEDGDDLQKERVESRFNGSDDFEEEIDRLDSSTEYFYRICVEYEDEDGDETLECGDTEDFETDN